MTNMAELWAKHFHLNSSSLGQTLFLVYFRFQEVKADDPLIWCLSTHGRLDTTFKSCRS